MKTSSLALLPGASVAAVAALPSAFAQTGDPVLQDVIVVSGSRIDTDGAITVIPDAAPFQGGDVTYLTARTPGGARVGNGELSGQMQYRGLFGERLNLRVDGQRFASGGPNLMDPVFHYAPAPLVAAVVIDRGVSPVSEGPGLAGGADAVFKRVGFSEGAAPAYGYDLSLGGRSVNDSYAVGGVVGAATDSWRFNLLGAQEEGDDSEFGGGVIAGTAFERDVYGLSAGFRTGVGEFSIDLRRQNTEASGNPPFPMDIQYFDTDFARLGYSREIGGIRIEAEAFFTDVVHLMDNFSLRPSPTPMMQRATFADATTRGGVVRLGVDAFGGRLTVGIDGESVDHDVRITNPNNPDFFVTPFPDITTGRLGGFGEWTGSLGALRSQLGLRVDQNTYEAGNADVGRALPMGPRNLAGAFNGADRDGDDTTVDAVARFWLPSNDGVTWRATFARKQQMPGYIQRYGWLPISASGGLADGNTYIGDLALEPETALIAEGGFDYQTERAYLRPTVFYREVDDYIQGVPFDATVGVIDSPVEMISSMNGDPTPLRWENVDARLFGADLDAGFDFDGPLRVDGVLSYVRGERRDIDDNLYRVAPPNATVALTWEAARWSATFEARGFAEQDEISVMNSEEPTDGYVVLSVYGDWKVREGMSLAFGIENLTDEVYEDHLSGYNRNGFGDVPLGARLPGAGRGVFLRLNLAR